MIFKQCKNPYRYYKSIVSICILLFSCILALVLFNISCQIKIPIISNSYKDIYKEDIESIQSFETYLPIKSDSIIQLYEKYDITDFHKTQRVKVNYIITLIDSFNNVVGHEYGIDTISIEHSINNFGLAGFKNKTLYISSCYFLMYDKHEIFKSIITHEYGHIIYSKLDIKEKEFIEKIWMSMKSCALLYIFQDGEYSYNAKFGGHPSDSPEELFASAYNLISNQVEEFDARVKYIDPKYLETINILKEIIKKYRLD